MGDDLSAKKNGKCQDWSADLSAKNIEKVYLFYTLFGAVRRPEKKSFFVMRLRFFPFEKLTISDIMRPLYPKISPPAAG